MRRGGIRCGLLALLGGGAWLFVGLVLADELLFAAAPAHYQHPAGFPAILLPDPAVTPGVVAHDGKDLCRTKWGQDARAVTEAMKRASYAAYGAVKRQGVCCEVDHLISRELGGADDPKNLWPQPWVQARQKDQVENWLHRQVCTGKLPIAAAQQQIATDWYAVYRRMGKQAAR